MTASRERISNWFDEGITKAATHMIVVCDTFDWEDYPKYVMPGQDAKETASALHGRNMQKVMEVYALHLPKDTQMNERRSFHWETKP